VSTWFRTYGFAEVAEGLLVGCYPVDPEDAAMLQWTGVDRVLNLVEEGEYRPGEREAVEQAFAELGIEERRLPFPDYGGLPAGLIDRAVVTIADWLDEGHRVYVHCRAGWQRSPAIATALLAARSDLDIDEALEVVRAQKPSADPLPHQRDDLWRWWEKSLSQPRAAGAP
jgi:protein-tyrosine phosphatase